MWLVRVSNLAGITGLTLGKCRVCGAMVASRRQPSCSFWLSAPPAVKSADVPLSSVGVTPTLNVGLQKWSANIMMAFITQII
jgi:hypothetical protein